MERLYWTIEIAATLIEHFVMFSFIATASGRRFRGTRHFLMLAVSSLVMTAVITWLNYSISLFSLITPMIGLTLVALVSRLNATGGLLLRAISTLLIFLIVLTDGYIEMLVMGWIAGIPESIVEIITAPGIPRYVFLCVDTATKITAYFLLRRYLPRLQTLSKKLQWVLLLLCAAGYAFMQYLCGVVLDPGVLSMQIAFVLTWVFILAFIAVMIFLMNSLVKQQSERQAAVLLQSENAMMAENYRKLHAIQQENAKNLHDFKHHIQAIKGLAESRKEEEIVSYADTLLETSYRQAAACHSGSDIIDAILNSKVAEAENHGIAFRFSANFQIPTNLDPVDVCGLLANQIDNAFDACKKIPTPADRNVKVEIKQVHNFAFFKVENTVAADPFAKNPELKSTKEDSGLHGLGLKSIRSIAEKYEGSLRNEYKDGWFVSVVSLSFQPGGGDNTIL